MAEEIRVSDEAFAYLKLQKGSLDRFSSNRQMWEKAYNDDILATYRECAPHLPATCWGLLDIGSGLGGIDVLFSRHFATIHNPPFVNLLDGEDDPPEMKLHRLTFNSMRVARQFHKDNGVKPEHFGYYTPTAESLPKPYDLVVSFGSWCFHYPPDTYLPLLFAPGGLHAETVVIIDRRNDRPEWASDLGHFFQEVAVIRTARKYTRVVMKPRTAP